MSELCFDNRVVIITGAGGGLGKAYATFFAERGASVVVNDLGSTGAGDGHSNAKAADIVVQEIIKKGGKAVANYDSVEFGEKIVQTAINAFGRVDIIINNAGILRDKSFSKMTDADWLLVHNVHVRGAYKVTKAAWPYMLKQGYGRIINTASAAGIYGNFGQANYSSAKLALHGFTMTLAREGAKKNILVNSIAPLAASRMTETVMPPELLAMLKPEFIVPLVAVLTHESCKETGSIFEAGAGFIAKLRRERSRGTVFKADASFTPGAVAAKWNEIIDFKQPVYPGSIMDTDWMSLLEQAKALSTNPQKEDLRFDGRVAIVTGAGGGLGRAYALLFAKLGAAVVVNDLGSGPNLAADKVVAEITGFGGKAVANYDSVEFGEKIVDTAIKAFGRVDIVVNNAGVLRDKSFIKMTDADWDLVYNVHLHGTYKVTKAAWPYMLQQKYGRIINTASAVGLYGNFGQANYSSAKAALIALANTLALEGKRSNIIVNTIAPNAGTNMTATIMPPEMVEALKPDYVAPFVAFLAHEMNTETGSVFECGSGWTSKVRWQRAGGFGFPINHALLPEHVAAKWSSICNFEDGRATYPLTTQDSFMGVQANFENKGNKPAGAGAAVGGSKNCIDVVAARAKDFPTHNFTYTEREVILYALGVGANRTDLHLVYENSDKFMALPTFCVIPAFACMWGNVPFGDFIPNFKPMMLLHGEQFLELHQLIPVSGTLQSKGRIVDIIDKGKGAVAVLSVVTKDSKGQVICENEFTNFIRGSGGFSQGNPVAPAPRNPAALALNNPPNRAPDAVIREQISSDQAALYRLSGDTNPLHIDPQMSKMGGFDVPILHGLCTFGIAGKHVLKAFGNDDPKLFKNIKVRFASPVFPGETVETKMWKEENGKKIILTVTVVERNVVAISNAAVELRVGGASASQASIASPKTSSAVVSVPGFMASKVFENVEKTLKTSDEKTKKDQVAKVKAVFAFDVKNTEGKVHSWFVDLKNGLGAVGAGKPQGKADMTVAISDKDFVELAMGKLNPQKAFMQGKIKVKGNIGLATKLDSVLKPNKAKL